jgi:trk system potassium uptake protein TrkH
MALRNGTRVGDNPAFVILASFVALIVFGTAALALPVAADQDHPGVLGALFLATSAVTVTGLITFDIDGLSLFGEVVVLALIQIGGFGIMTIGTVVGLVTARRLGVRQRVLARTEIGSIDLGEVRNLVGAILRITVIIESVAALLLAAALVVVHGRPVAAGLYEGTFLSISAFNNAGLTPSQAGLTPFGTDPAVIGVVSIAIILGGLGFPVIIELSRRSRPARWSLHAKLVIGATLLLLVVGPLVMILFEWTNPATLGPLDTADKLLASWFQGVTPRTAGFATVDIGGLNAPTQLVMIMLMFVGAAPASTGGGIRITTFALLGFVLWSVVRGDGETHAFRRRIPDAVVRQSISIVLLSIGAVIGTTLALLALTDFDLMSTMFEATSAFGTVGLSTGITGDLPGLGQVLLMLLMLTGRIGPVTVITALALRERPRLYRYPEERPIVG